MLEFFSITFALLGLCISAYNAHTNRKNQAIARENLDRQIEKEERLIELPPKGKSLDDWIKDSRTGKAAARKSSGFAILLIASALGTLSVSFSIKWNKTLAENSDLKALVKQKTESESAYVIELKGQIEAVKKERDLVQFEMNKLVSELERLQKKTNPP